MGQTVINKRKHGGSTPHNMSSVTKFGDECFAPVWGGVLQNTDEERNLLGNVVDVCDYLWRSLGGHTLNRSQRSPRGWGEGRMGQARREELSPTGAVRMTVRNVPFHCNNREQTSTPAWTAHPCWSYLHLSPRHLSEAGLASSWLANAIEKSDGSVYFHVLALSKLFVVFLSMLPFKIFLQTVAKLHLVPKFHGEWFNVLPRIAGTPICPKEKMSYLDI